MKPASDLIDRHDRKYQFVVALANSPESRRRGDSALQLAFACARTRPEAGVSDMVALAGEQHSARQCLARFKRRSAAPPLLRVVEGLLRSNYTKPKPLIARIGEDEPTE